MAFRPCVTQENALLVEEWKEWKRRLFLREGVEPAGTCEYREGVRILSAIVAEAIKRDLTRENHVSATGEGVLLVPIMVAGLGLLFPFLEVFPEARIWSIWPGHVVPTDALRPVVYRFDFLMRRQGDCCIILDQASATGNTLRCAIDALSVEEEESHRIIIATLFASQRAVERFSGRHDFYVIDGCGREADNHMLDPGPGDTGQRWRGIVPSASVPCEERRATGKRA